MSPARNFAKAALRAPIALYRYTISPLLGANCRYLPSCSQYASDAIDMNGAWKGSWLALARLCRCHPWGASGYDPAPDITGERHVLAPWRYGRWSGRHIADGLEKRPKRPRGAADVRRRGPQK